MLAKTLCFLAAFVCSFIRQIPHERLELSGWNLQAVFTAPTDDLISLWRSKVKVTAGHGEGWGVEFHLLVSVNNLNAFLYRMSSWLAFWCGCRISKLRLSADDNVDGQLREARNVILPRVWLGVGCQSDGGDNDGTTGWLAAGTQHTNATHRSLSVTAWLAQRVHVGSEKHTVIARSLTRLWYLPQTSHFCPVICYCSWICPIGIMVHGFSIILLRITVHSADINEMSIHWRI